MRWLIDYQGMSDSFLKGQFQVQQAFWPAGFPGSLTDTPFKLDVAKAKALLPEAGYPNGFEASFDVPSPSPLPAMAQSIQAPMGQARIPPNPVTAEENHEKPTHPPRH